MPTPRKPGRPPSLDPHTERVPARFTLEQRVRLEAEARALGVSLAELIRRRTLVDPSEPLALSPVVARRS
jgi:hypothetical protein